jgi:pyruvate/2-oxoglutarate dehydrogenase complex dihydrolipoamide dehydrogenase (E3) component
MASDVNIEQFHNLIIGSGEAGKYLAWNLAKTGQTTALVERSMVGGSCPNIACLPRPTCKPNADEVGLQ